MRTRSPLLPGLPRHGFTLIELLVVIAIILALIGILLPVVQVVRTSVRKAQTASLVQTMYAACEVYAIEDRRHLPPLPETDLSLRTTLGGGGAPRLLDLLQDRGAIVHGNQLGEAGADGIPGRPLLDAWSRRVRYQPDANMDGVIDKPAPQSDWNAKNREPFPYLWSLGRPADDEAADAQPDQARRWIYVTSTP